VFGAIQAYLSIYFDYWSVNCSRCFPESRDSVLELADVWIILQQKPPAKTLDGSKGPNQSLVNSPPFIPEYNLRRLLCEDDHGDQQIFQQVAVKREIPHQRHVPHGHVCIHGTGGLFGVF